MQQHQSTRPSERAIRSALVGVVVGCLAGPAGALEVLPVSHVEAVRRADAIVRGRVIRRETRWNVQHTLPITAVTLEIDDSLKGPPSGQLTLDFAGGDVDGESVRISDLPIPMVGSVLVVFSYRSDVPTLSPIVGANQWYFELVPHPSVRDDSALVDHDGRTLVDLSRGHPTTTPTKSMRAVASEDTAQRSTSSETPEIYDAAGRRQPTPQARALQTPAQPMTWSRFREVTAEAVAHAQEDGAP